MVEVKEFRKMKKSWDQKVYEDDLKAKEEQRQAELARNTPEVRGDIKSDRVDTSQ